MRIIILVFLVLCLVQIFVFFNLLNTSVFPNNFLNLTKSRDNIESIYPGGGDQVKRVSYDGRIK